MIDLRLKRAYDPPARDDGLRVLVDRLWPRGLSREGARIDLWLKQVAPSDELRRWFGHEPQRWPEFVQRYRAELADDPDHLAPLRRLAAEHERITLVFAAKDTRRNNAVVLRSLIDHAGPSRPD